jgi:hypothetical protein
MRGDYAPFRTFRSREEAEELAASLQAAGFHPSVVQNYAFVSSAFVGEVPDYSVVMLPSEDFLRAEHALEEEAERAIAEVSPDHYLFGFSTEELLDVVAKPDEWNAFDRCLARKLLVERGMPVKDDLQERVLEERIEDLSEPAPSQTALIIFAYVIGICGGFLAAFIGYHLNTAKKILPNGERVYVYRDADRKHGKILFFGGLVIFTLGALVWLSQL